MKEYKKIFNKEHESKYFSPGRINIIGEHIDYNGGFCLPMSIDKGTFAYVSKSQDKTFRIYSENFLEQGVYSINPDEEQIYNRKKGWSNIFSGMIFIMKDHLKNIDFGLDIYFKSTLPIGSGLSSSASISMLVGHILNEWYKLNLTILELVYLTQKMENKFLGAQTGILDQYAIGFGKKDQAILIDTSIPKHEYFKSDFNDYVFLIVNTNIQRDLIESNYNQRVSECKKGLEILKKEGYKIKNLCELKVSKLNDIEKIIQDNNVFKRVRHCITEQNRTIKASKKLSDINALGSLLKESHISLRDDYEVTGIFLDFIFDFSINLDYVSGVRMTGAGFGGSAIVLIKKNMIDEYKKIFTKAYYENFKIYPFYLEAKSSKGTHKC